MMFLPSVLCAATASRRRSTNCTLLVLTTGALAALALTSCNSEPDLGAVSGVVTADGQPLANAVVVFEPQGAPASRGVTDPAGRYELVYVANQKGARVGQHRVRVFTGSEEMQIDPYSHYRTGDELVAEVKSGDNSFDFQLTRSPK